MNLLLAFYTEPNTHKYLLQLQNCVQKYERLIFSCPTTKRLEMLLHLFLSLCTF